MTPKHTAAKKAARTAQRERPPRDGVTVKRHSPEQPIDVGFLPNLLGYNIRRAQIALWRDLVRVRGAGTIRPAVFSLMILAEANPGIAQSQLAAQLDIDKATIVALVDGLQRERWITRKQSSSDRRRNGIWLTQLGEHELLGLKTLMLEHEMNFTRLFSADEMADFLRYLRRIHP